MAWLVHIKTISHGLLQRARSLRKQIRAWFSNACLETAERQRIAAPSFERIRAFWIGSLRIWRVCKSSWALRTAAGLRNTWTRFERLNDEFKRRSSRHRTP